MSSRVFFARSASADTPAMNNWRTKRVTAQITDRLTQPASRYSRKLVTERRSGGTIAIERQTDSRTVRRGSHVPYHRYRSLSNYPAPRDLDDHVHARARSCSCKSVGPFIVPERYLREKKTPINDPRARATRLFQRRWLIRANSTRYESSRDLSRRIETRARL